MGKNPELAETGSIGYDWPKGIKNIGESTGRCFNYYILSGDNCYFNSCFFNRLLMNYLQNITSSLLHPITCVSIILFSIHQIFQYILNISLPIMDNYLDMFLMGIIILSLRLFEKRIMLFETKGLGLSNYEIILISIFVPLVTEIIFPKFNSSFTSDFFDFIPFAFGAIIFYFFINKPLSPKLDSVNYKKIYE